MTPNGVEKVPVQKTVFDLDTFTEVLVGKTYDFAPVTSVAEALAALGNDEAKLLSAVNDGLRAEKTRQARADASGWLAFDDEGKLTAEPFKGTLADDKKVNALVLTLAKTVFGFNKDMTAEQKNASRDAARNMIQTTPAIKDGLVKSAALSASEPEEAGAGA